MEGKLRGRKEVMGKCEAERRKDQGKIVAIKWREKRKGGRGKREVERKRRKREGDGGGRKGDRRRVSLPLSSSVVPP